MATEKDIEEIKSRLNIYDIVSSYITLKRSGSNYFGLCPFHSEKSPSFSVNSEMGIFKCFGCQESGDIITFIEKIENLNFKEAIEKLADIAGIKLTNTFQNEKSEKKRIIEINTLAHELFKYLLMKHKVGEDALEYLKRRNIKTQSINEFGLGYDYKNTLVKTLRQRGFKDNEIIKYGLGVIRNGILVDKYRDRLIFPIYSITGEIIGFSGRIIVKNDNIPKYINSPETEVFKKNNILYGLYNTKKYIKEKDSVVLLEGPTDVIAAYQNGVKNICAVQGTSLTLNHINILKRFTDNIAFCFDQDNAGLKALRRSFFIALDANITPKVVKITNAKDVDEKVSRNLKGFREEMEIKLDLIEFLINQDIKEFNTSSLDGKLKVIDDILPFLIKIKDDIKRTHYVQRLSEAIQIEESKIKVMIDSKSEYFKKDIIKKVEVRLRKENFRLTYLLALFLQYNKELKENIIAFDESLIFDPNIKALFIKIKNWIKDGKDLKECLNTLDEKDKELCINLMTINLKPFKSDNPEYIRKELDSIKAILKRKSTLNQINQLKNTLWIYEQENDEEKIIDIVEKISILTRQIHN